MKISYANKKIEKHFQDYGLMQKKISFEWVRKIKKLTNQLEAADNFGIYLDLGLGQPEQLVEKGEEIKYSLHVSANVRLIIRLNASKDEIRNCSEIEVEGVCDYHGSKENWYLC